ncbi:PREDICTED: aminopeptidase N-like [Ceratosolen solmsi marchali]|uniref:Aminopeptidase n=1 Tax=Ceratosolen solmsi marchali TaxID=326594 RepID=A0AAJ7DVH9_9HYME|nr:PREDICTED: aminopeptidase N-like [Ceratosolen solmsi marchali]
MYKIINILLIIYIVTANAHLHFPLKLNTNAELLSNKTQSKVNYTLPNSIIPKKYTLSLTTYLDEGLEKRFTFDGIVEIEIEILTKVRSIIFHSKDLRFDRNNIHLRIDKIEIQEFFVQFDKSKDFVNITSLKDDFQTGIYYLKINYVGVLSDDMHGFYRSSYMNAGVKKWLATTHFEPVGARRAFPCFDEPQYKATFDVSIVNNKKYIVLSNTKVKNVVVSNEMKTTSFFTTPPMSTYLLAFVVSDFTSISNKNLNFSIYSRPNAIQYGNMALNVSEKILKALEDFTGIPFHINKMEQAAIPDFAAGAMENWGLVLYREKSLLYDDKVLTTSDKQNIVETIAHEFAHQWFGDLVSPKWWKYLWLNEGFANFFQTYITEKIEPEWHSIEQAVIKSIQNNAFDFDSNLSTHPLNQDVESPSEINAIFDRISYEKGGAVIRMMQHFLTETVFQKGLQNYLTKKSLSVANSDDLLAAIQEVIDKKNFPLDLKAIMDKWINYKGYPAVYVTRYYKTSTVELKQERFVKYNASREEKGNKYEWHIPINYAIQSKPDFVTTIPQHWLKSTAMNISVDVDSKDWLILNKQQTGFYRVNYDDDNWKLITNYLNSENRTKIHVLNRAQLMDDALAFVKQEKLSLKILLQLTSYLKNETNYIAWQPAFKTYLWLKTKLSNTGYYTIFKDYVLNSTTNLLTSVGLEESENDKHLTKLNRIVALKWVCSLGHQECTTKMQEKLVMWLDNSTKNRLSPDLKKITLCYGLQSADIDIWQKVLDKCVETTDPDNQKELLVALGCSNNNQILQKYFNFILNDTSPFNNTFSVISTAISSALENSEVGIDTALDYVIKRFITLLRKIKNEDQISSLFSNIGSKITTTIQIEKLKTTINMDIPENITNQGIKFAENNIKWLTDNKETLRLWMKDINSYSKSSDIRITWGYLTLVTLILLITHFNIN